MNRIELILLAVVVLLVFAAAFYFLIPGQNETLIENSLKVKSKSPIGDIQDRMSSQKILLEQHLFAANDSRNSAIAIMSAEVTRATAQQGKNVTAYALVEGGAPLCGDSDCTGAVVIVQIGPCNCVYFNPTQVIVEVDKDFLFAQTVRVGRLIGYALNQAR